MKVFKNVTLIIFVVIIVILSAGVLFLRILFPTPLSKEATEKDFVKNQDTIMIVINYLSNAKYAEMSIHSTGDIGVMFANLDGYITVDDSQVVEAMDTLLKRKGYSLISKDGNTIHFQRSTRFRDFSSGIAYSIDGSEPLLLYLTKIEPLSKPNWYYYEEDFNEFRKRERLQ